MANPARAAIPYTGFVCRDTVESYSGVGGREKFLNDMFTFCITLKSYHMICESVAEIISHDF